MTNDDYTPFLPIVIIIANCFLVFSTSYLAFIVGKQTVEEKTVVYCIEQPTACKTKYDYYKSEAQK